MNRKTKQIFTIIILLLPILGIVGTMYGKQWMSDTFIAGGLTPTEASEFTVADLRAVNEAYMILIGQPVFDEGYLDFYEWLSSVTPPFVFDISNPLLQAIDSLLLTFIVLTVLFFAIYMLRKKR